MMVKRSLRFELKFEFGLLQRRGGFATFRLYAKKRIHIGSLGVLVRRLWNVCARNFKSLKYTCSKSILWQADI